MLRKVLGIAVATTALAGSPASAGVYCYQNAAFSACASATVTVQNGLTQLTIQVQNVEEHSLE